MRLYFLRNVRAEYAPGKEFKEGCVYDIPLNNLSTMIENKFAVPEEDRPKGAITIKKPVSKKQIPKKQRKRRAKK